MVSGSGWGHKSLVALDNILALACSILSSIGWIPRRTSSAVIGVEISAPVAVLRARAWVDLSFLSAVEPLTAGYHIGAAYSMHGLMDVM